MDKRIELYWVEKYPDLFAEYHTTIYRSPMAWGFACGNGWFNIMDQLWKDLSKFKKLSIAQVKEKFGGLTIYTRSQNYAEVTKLINDVGAKSHITCEMCGKPGKTGNYDGWIFTLCNSCSKLEQAKWVVSEQLGAEIAEKLGLRTRCETDADHISDFHHTSCVVCGAIRNKTSNFKWINPPKTKGD